MAAIVVTNKGSFKNTKHFLKKAEGMDKYSRLPSLAQMGVDALASATPTRSGKTAASWGYEINISGAEVSIEWFNTNINEGVNIAIILQYGHGTGTGGYVAGQDYINPAIQPVFDKIADLVWKEVMS